MPALETKNASSPKISVLVVVYNGAGFVERCLDSILEQDFDDYEVIVVDNGSTDLAVEAATPGYPDVQFVRSPRNLGYAGGINKGLELVRGEYVAPLNVDTEVAQDWLRMMWDCLRTHPDAGAVTPLIVIDQARDRVNTMGGAVHVTGLSFCNGLGLPRREAPSAPFRVPGLSGASFMMPTRLLRELGGAPAECFMGNDDVLLSWAIRLAGREIYCEPASTVFHRYHLTLDPQKLFTVERNRLFLLLTSLRARTLVLVAPALLSVELAILLYCALKGPEHLAAKLGAYGAVLLESPALPARRKRVQARRKVSDWRVARALDWVPQWRQLAYLLRHDPPHR